MATREWGLVSHSQYMPSSVPVKLAGKIRRRRFFPANVLSALFKISELFSKSRRELKRSVAYNCIW